jgi:hypothetical protein
MSSIEEGQRNKSKKKKKKERERKKYDETPTLFKLGF